MFVVPGRDGKSVPGLIEIEEGSREWGRDRNLPHLHSCLAPGNWHDIVKIGRYRTVLMGYYRMAGRNRPSLPFVWLFAFWGLFWYNVGVQ